jgi:hypothetical protein
MEKPCRALRVTKSLLKCSGAVLISSLRTLRGLGVSAVDRFPAGIYRRGAENAEKFSNSDTTKMFQLPWVSKGIVGITVDE